MSTQTIATENKIIDDGIRPWGHYEVLSGDDHSGYKVKKITVKPHQKLSLQSHEFRKEIWTVIHGSGQAVKGDKMIDLKLGETIIIELKERHRLINNTDQMLVIIEVQVGSYLGEDDIKRYSDDYGRGATFTTSPKV
ncbi:MAG: mannose-6-phosphate isomerase [Edafosvirus sp.]|uniref:Mannose-6-phosphate isomerase n=1 Tax=Edafosvirus sp. TaxID=2487765 RepID=A0A3G4ZT86_9VIRU|nr:MAG: mannose-6-phosphate isomerase [Edafosvirus sp.]